MESGSRSARTLLPSVLGLVLAGANVSAQAWLPPKGEAAFSLGWSRTWADHHLDYLGNSLAPAT